ncbi:hypothetical protein GJAV_G00156140 [Gymnothorax javanicus]|nr:hypothetical protein GJAV_G00156140 [Gymnothorax javanicus]
MKPEVLTGYPDLVLSIRGVILGEKVRKEMVEKGIKEMKKEAREKMKKEAREMKQEAKTEMKQKKDKQKEDILIAVCGLLNSGGGVISIEPENEGYDFNTDALGQDVESALAQLVNPAFVNEFVQSWQQDSKFYIFVKTWCSSGKRPRICSISTGLWQRSGTLAVQVSPVAVEELLQKKSKVSENNQIDQFYERISVKMNELLGFGENTTVDFKDFRTDNVSVRLRECLPKYISAFANTAGGFLFIGVDDGRRVVGCGRGEKKDKLQKRLEEICSKAIAVHRCTCPSRSSSWTVEHRIIDVLDENVAKPQSYVLAIRVPPFCCVVFEKHPDSWLIEDCELHPFRPKPCAPTAEPCPHTAEPRTPAERWLRMMDRADPVDKLTRDFGKLSLEHTPQSRAVYGFKDQHLEQLQATLFPVDKDDISLGPEPLKEALFGKYENLRNLQTLERQLGDPGALIFSRSWAVDVGCVRNSKVICDALLISQNSLPCLYTVVREEDSQDLWEYATSTALQIKQKLVNVGGYTGFVCVVPKLVSCQTGKLISRGRICPDGGAEILYPDIYKLSAVDEVKSLLRSLVIVLLSFTSALSDELGYEFLNLLTEEQFEFFQRYNHFRKLFIHGLPGSGKTVLAVEKIKRIKNEYGCTKDDILYICENQPLRNFMGKKDICQCVTRTTFMLRGEQHFSDVKHIIVDEGQNFRDEDGDWIQKAKNIVKKNGKNGVFWVFLDYFQQSHNKPSGLPPVDQQNYRAYLYTVVRNSALVQRGVPQAVLQLQCIIFRRVSGAAFMAVMIVFVILHFSSPFKPEYISIDLEALLDYFDELFDRIDNMDKETNIDRNEPAKAISSSTPFSKRPRPDSLDSTGTSPSPKPPCCTTTEVSDILISIENKLTGLDARIALIEVLHKEFQSLRYSLEYSQEQIDTLTKENKSLQHSVNALTDQLAFTTADNKNMKETILDLQARSMRDNLVFSGIPEQPTEDPETSVKEFMSKQLKLPTETVNNITFHRVHRLGTKNPLSNRPRQSLRNSSILNKNN